MSGQSLHQALSISELNQSKTTRLPISLWDLDILHVASPVVEEVTKLVLVHLVTQFAYEGNERRGVGDLDILLVGLPGGRSGGLLLLLLLLLLGSGLAVQAGFALSLSFHRLVVHAAIVGGAIVLGPVHACGRCGEERRGGVRVKVMRCE
jgi:hypothetical protein